MFNLTEKTIIFFEKVSKYSRKHKWLIVISVVVIISIVVVPFSLTSKSDTVKTKNYTDSLHAFTIIVPKTWTTEQEEGNNITGENTSHPVTQQIEISQLYVPPEEGITIQVYKGKSTCPLDNALTTTIAGFPASYDPTVQTWTIPTTKATVTVSISYPGSNMFHNIPMQTPAPSIVVEQSKKHILEILHTLKLTNLIPISCHH